MATTIIDFWGGWSYNICSTQKHHRGKRECAHDLEGHVAYVRICEWHISLYTFVYIYIYKSTCFTCDARTKSHRTCQGRVREDSEMQRGKSRSSAMMTPTRRVCTTTSDGKAVGSRIHYIPNYIVFLFLTTDIFSLSSWRYLPTRHFHFIQTD